MLTLTNRIDMRPGAVPLVIHLGQYDSDFSLVFELYSSAGNFTVESGTTAMIRGTKTDGHAYDADATIDISAKTVTVTGSEQMTAAKGRNVYELVLTKSGKVLSTANFILDVERAAMDADTIASESVLKELNAIIAGAATATEAAADAASAADRAEDAADSVSSASAQIATNTSDIADLKADFEQFVPGLSDNAKTALLNCFQHVAWLDHQSDYYQVLRDALYASDTVVSISAVFNQGSVVIYPDESLDNLRTMLVVTATYSDGHTGVVTEYTLSGNLVGDTSSIITVTYRDKTTTFTVAVTDYEWGSDYTWLYRPGVDGLLSQNENVSNVAAIGGQTYATETLNGDVLNLSAEYNGNNYGSIFKLIPLTSTSASLKAKVKFNALPISSPGGGLRMQVSNGTSGAQLFVYRDAENPDQPRISTFSPTAMRLADITLNRWYILTCELSGNTQIIKVDDVMYTPSALSTYANTETRLIVLEPDNSVSSAPGDLSFDLAWVAFKDNSN